MLFDKETTTDTDYRHRQGAVWLGLHLPPTRSSRSSLQTPYRSIPDMAATRSVSPAWKSENSSPLHGATCTQYPTKPALSSIYSTFERGFHENLYFIGNCDRRLLRVSIHHCPIVHRTQVAFVRSLSKGTRTALSIPTPQERGLPARRAQLAARTRVNEERPPH